MTSQLSTNEGTPHAISMATPRASANPYGEVMLTARGTPFTPRRQALKAERDHLASQLYKIRDAREEAEAISGGTQALESQLMEVRMAHRQEMEEVAREHEAVQRDALELRQRLESCVEEMEESRIEADEAKAQLAAALSDQGVTLRERDEARERARVVAEELAKCQAQLLGVQVAQAESSQGSAVEALREELTELQLWRAEEEAVSSKRRPELLQEAELLHRELASAQEKMLGLKRENKRLVTDKRLANDEIEELRARMEDALAEIDDLHEVIQLQEQLELEADAISNISTSGIADIIKDRDTLQARVDQLEAMIGEEVAAETRPGGNISRADLMRHTGSLQEELVEVQLQHINTKKRLHTSAGALKQASGSLEHTTTSLAEAFQSLQAALRLGPPEGDALGLPEGDARLAHLMQEMEAHLETQQGAVLTCKQHVRDIEEQDTPVSIRPNPSPSASASSSLSRSRDISWGSPRC